jgi:hypothetical protein
VYIGQKSLLLPPTWNEKAAIDLAKSQWDKRPTFVWRFDLTEFIGNHETAAISDEDELLWTEKSAGGLPWADLVNWPEEKSIDDFSSRDPYSGDDAEKETYGGAEEQQEDLLADNPLKPNKPDERNQAQAPEGNSTFAPEVRNPVFGGPTNQFRKPKVVHRICSRCAMVPWLLSLFSAKTPTNGVLALGPGMV